MKNMKEEKFWLDTPQRIFLEKVIQKIDKGWSLYSYNTKKGIERCLERGYYDSGHREYYNELRKDYIETFCRGEIKGSITWDDDITWSM